MIIINRKLLILVLVIGVVFSIVTCIHDPCLLAITPYKSVSSSTDFVVKNAILIKYQGKTTDVVIPDSLGITSIGDSAFANCRDLTSLVIPNSLISVGFRAFCFTEIKVPIIVDKDKTICYIPLSLSSYTIPNTVKTINDGAFMDCLNLTSVIIPNSVTYIGKVAFYGCVNLRSLIVPNSVKGVGEAAFSNTKIAHPITIKCCHQK